MVYHARHVDIMVQFMELNTGANDNTTPAAEDRRWMVRTRTASQGAANSADTVAKQLIRLRHSLSKQGSCLRPSELCNTRLPHLYHLMVNCAVLPRR